MQQTTDRAHLSMPRVSPGRHSDFSASGLCGVSGSAATWKQWLHLLNRPAPKLGAALATLSFLVLCIPWPQLNHPSTSSSAFQLQLDSRNRGGVSSSSLPGSHLVARRLGGPGAGADQPPADNHMQAAHESNTSSFKGDTVGADSTSSQTNTGHTAKRLDSVQQSVPQVAVPVRLPPTARRTPPHSSTHSLLNPDVYGQDQPAPAAAAAIEALKLPDEMLLEWAGSEEYAHDEGLLREIARACAARTNEFIWLHPDTQKVVISQTAEVESCPLLDIMLRASERGMGMCTDAALYVLHAGARIIPRINMAIYEKGCGGLTARLLLETMYGDFLSDNPLVTHVMLPNTEHMFVEDAWKHKRVHLYLCKVRYCPSYLAQYNADLGGAAQVWYVGHTSTDVRMGADGQGPAANYDKFLHVKGQSGLKHTLETLRCWRANPQLPTLNVIGLVSEEDMEQFGDQSNIKLLTPLAEDGSQQLLEAEAVRQMQAECGVHVCASEREGFGHYLNEARAAGALVLTTDFQPMHEMVDEASGILIPPFGVYSTPSWQALGPYGPLRARLSSLRVCAAAQRAVALSRDERAARGKAARLRYLADKWRFEARIAEFVVWLACVRDLGRTPCAHLVPSVKANQTTSSTAAIDTAGPFTPGSVTNDGNLVLAHGVKAGRGEGRWVKVPTSPPAPADAAAREGANIQSSKEDGAQAPPPVEESQLWEYAAVEVT